MASTRVTLQVNSASVNPGRVADLYLRATMQWAVKEQQLVEGPMVITGDGGGGGVSSLGEICPRAAKAEINLAASNMFHNV